MTGHSIQIQFSPVGIDSSMTLALFDKHFPGRRAQLKKDILYHALCCFNQDGIEATTIEQIRQASDASVGAIYYHFGDKEGIIAQLYFLALQDQLQHRQQYLERATSLETFVKAIIFSYIDWVSQHQELARFQAGSRFYVVKSQYKHQLKDMNQQRNQAIFNLLKILCPTDILQQLPLHVILSLILGPVQHYVKLWLVGRVKAAPAQHQHAFADAAWRAVSPYFSNSVC